MTMKWKKNNPIWFAVGGFEHSLSLERLHPIFVESYTFVCASSSSSGLRCGADLFHFIFLSVEIHLIFNVVYSERETHIYDAWTRFTFVECFTVFFHLLDAYWTTSCSFDLVVVSCMEHTSNTFIADKETHAWRKWRQCPLNYWVRMFAICELQIGHSDFSLQRKNMQIH